MAFLSAAIQQHGDGIAGAQMVGVGEGFSHQHFTKVAGREPAPGAQEEAIEFRWGEVGQRTHHPAGRFVQAGQGHTGNGGNARGDRVWGAFQMREHFGETIGLVILPARGLQRVDQTPRHDHHGQAARHHQGDGDRLTFHAVQVTPEFAVEMGEHHQFKLLAGARCALVRT